MITITLVLLILAFICVVLALLGVGTRVDLTALGLLFVILTLLLGNIR